MLQEHVSLLESLFSSTAGHAPLVRLVAGSIMALAFGVNTFVTYAMLRYMRGWRRTAYVSYSVSVALAAGINAYIRLAWLIEGEPLSFPDWQALLVAPVYLFAGFQGIRSINKILEEKKKGMPGPAGPYEHGPSSGSGDNNPQ